MFTGLVEGMGRVEKLERLGADARLWLEPSWPVAESVLGESVAVNGACLTVAARHAQSLLLDVSAETLSRSNLGGLKPGGRVNLERALRLGDRLGGHLVSGHVDCVGTVRDASPVGGSLRVSVALPAAHMRYVLLKGSITIDGVSLTVNEVSADSCSVNLIPHTAAQTTLHLVKAGQSVNIETDLIAKYIERLMQPKAEDGAGGQGISFEDLARMGY